MRHAFKKTPEKKPLDGKLAEDFINGAGSREPEEHQEAEEVLAAPGEESSEPSEPKEEHPEAEEVLADAGESPTDGPGKCIGIMGETFGWGNLLYFLCLVLPPLLLGAAGVVNVHGILLVIWIILAVIYLWLFLPRFLFVHSPERGQGCGCMRGLEYLMPRGKGKTREFTSRRRLIFVLGMVVLWAFPLFFLLFWGQWFLLIVFVLSLVGMLLTVGRHLESKDECFSSMLDGPDDPPEEFESDEESY
jgi:hypothetical protein